MMPEDADIDAACMRRLQGGDDQALNELMSRWQSPLTSFLFRYTAHETTAIDLAQETFVRAYEKRFQYRGGRFSSWLFSIAIHLAKNHFRWQARHPAVSLESREENHPAGQIAANAASPSDQAASAELGLAIAQAVQSLPHDLKTVILLAEYHDQSCAEIATTLGCTSKAVETRLYRARQILRTKLAGWLEGDI